LSAFFVHEQIADEFATRLVISLQKLKMGSPFDPQTDIGPVASRIIFSRMLKQLKEAEELGAEIIYGGNVITEAVTGLPIVVPTVLTHCSPQLSVVEKETFGPVFPIISFKSLNDLMPVLDATNYGLNASVFGNCPDELISYLRSTHRNVYQNSTCVSPENLETRILDGGFRRSGFIWEQAETYCSRTGPRLLTLELSHPA
jgi:succinate-semialdehyde dehydrogenase/glutarate-semialdehyde dehydrogenase